MGQQQLLLVILVTIIVGIATVVAINTFGSAADQANKDAVRQDLLTAVADARGYWQKPEMMGGGGKDFTNISMDDVKLPTSNENADTYEVSSSDVNTVTFKATLADGSTMTAELNMTTPDDPSVTWGS